MNKIFIACPISKYINGNEFINDMFRTFIEGLHALCVNYSSEVFLALKREEFGEKIMTDTCAVLDFEEMKTSDFVIAIPEDSMGVAVELGWATILKRQTLLLLDRQQRYTPLISGMGDITNTTIIYYEGILDESVLNEVRDKLESIV